LRAADGDDAAQGGNLGAGTPRFPLKSRIGQSDGRPKRATATTKAGKERPEPVENRCAPLRTVPKVARDVPRIGTKRAPGWVRGSHRRIGGLFVATWSTFTSSDPGAPGRRPTRRVSDALTYHARRSR